VDFYVTDQLLTTYAAFLNHLRKSRNATEQYISYLSNSRKPKGSAVYMTTEIGIPMRLVRLVKMFTRNPK
jgi:hypothetical protein